VDLYFEGKHTSRVSDNAEPT